MTIETLDADASTALMTDDVELRLPDGSELHGREEVAGGLPGLVAGPFPGRPLRKGMKCCGAQW